MELFTAIGLIWAVMIVFRAISSKIEADEKLEAFKVEADKRIRMVVLETVNGHDDIIFAYDGENNQFLGQGTDEEELKKRIIERFPEKVFILNDKVFSGLKSNIEVHLGKSITG